MVFSLIFVFNLPLFLYFPLPHLYPQGEDLRKPTYILPREGGGFEGSLIPSQNEGEDLRGPLYPPFRGLRSLTYILPLPLGSGED